MQVRAFSILSVLVCWAAWARAGQGNLEKQSDKVAPLPVPEILGSSGLPVGAQASAPEDAKKWADLLAREGSYASASRSYENLARRWPGSAGAESAMLQASRNALAAGDYLRSHRLLGKLRQRWPQGTMSHQCDLTELQIAESRIVVGSAPRASKKSRVRAAGLAYKTFCRILKRERAGEIAQRAALGKAQALNLMEKVGPALKTLAAFLRHYPRSVLVPTVRSLMARIRAGRARHRSSERHELQVSREGAGWALEAVEGDAPGTPVRQALNETYREISERQAQLKLEEAALYLRLKRASSAHCVLLSILRKYGETKAAVRAAALLEELSGR
jgi:outer membrane protein assembly factor BamD (BamD/ComL family)